MTIDEIITENAKIIGLHIEIQQDTLCCKLTFEFIYTQQTVTIYNNMENNDKVSICELLHSLMFYTYVDSLDKIYCRVVRVKHSFDKIYEIGHPLLEDWIKV